MKNTITLFLLSFLIFSCGNESKPVVEEVSTVENCEYSVDAQNIKFTWTAFKTTAKVGVNGSFDQIKISNDSKSSEIPSLVLNTTFEIMLGSINSGNPERDSKLVDKFFAKLANIETFTGTIQECTGDNSEGKAIILLNANNVEHSVLMNYSVKEDTLALSGTLDLLDWKAEDALTSINQACLDLHKGEDGVSKTWSDMEIKVLVPLKKVCQ